MSPDKFGFPTEDEQKQRLIKRLNFPHDQEMHDESQCDLRCDWCEMCLHINESCIIYTLEICEGCYDDSDI